MLIRNLGIARPDVVGLEYVPQRRSSARRRVCLSAGHIQGYGFRVIRSLVVQGELTNWAYTHRGEPLEPVRTELELSTDFVNSPSTAKRDVLLEKGVILVYIDKREPNSPELAKVGTLAYESEWANVYSLTGNR